ncbi:Ni/Fe-hydrogenase, b-type cytochrome subunit [Arcanobacterium hippocoleae]
MSTPNEVEFFAPSEAAANLPIEVGGAYSIGKLSKRRLLSMAAVAPENTQDPVDLALNYALQNETNGLMEARRVPETAHEEATPERRYSLTAIPDFVTTEGQTHDLMIMRGNLESVLRAAKCSREDRTLMRRNAQMAKMRGYRSLAVASAEVINGNPEEFQVQGFVNIRPSELSDLKDDGSEATRGDWVRLNVWSPLLRLLHWANVALIFVLSCTGYYIMDPFFGGSYFMGIELGFLMGWVRYTHFTAAFLWIAIGVLRLWLAFTSRDRYMRWPTFWPLKNKEDFRNLWGTAKHYLFLTDDGPLYIAHNPLQQLTYTGIYVIGFFQMITGLALYGLYHQNNPVWQFFAMPVHWIGIPATRLIHAMIMFIFWCFVIAHVYLAVRADSMERHGGISSMINGGVWLKRGSKPVDAPEV